MTSKLLQRHSLKNRITLFTLGIFLLSIWALALYASRELRRDMQAQLGEQQFSVTSLLAAQVEQEMQERLSALKAIAPQIKPALLDNPSALQTLLEQRPVLQSHFSGGTFVMRPDGITVAAMPALPERLGVNLSDRDYVIRAVRDGQTSVGKPVIGRGKPHPVFAMATPIFGPDGGVIGVLSGVTDLGAPNFLDSITDHPFGKTGGYLLVVPQHRLVVTATDKRRIMEQLPEPGVNPGIDRSINGFEGFGTWINPFGVEVLVATKAVASAGWFVASVMPTEEAFAAINALQQRVLLATLLLTLLAGFLTWWMLRLQLAPMLDTIQTLTGLTDAKLPPVPLPVSQHNEIGDLIASFNGLLASLAQRDTELKESQSLLRISQHQSKTGGWEWDSDQHSMTWTDETYRLHGLVPGTAMADSKLLIETSLACYLPEDRATVEQAFWRCVNQGEAYELELRFCSRPDSAPLWVRTTAQAVWSGNRITRVVGTLMDITERKQRENLQSTRLRLMTAADGQSLHELLVATLDEACALTSSPIGFYHFLETDQKTLTLQAWSTRTSQQYCKAVGAGRHYDINEAGVWVECVRLGKPVIHNDYAALPNKRGLPSGHAQVLREMVVPIFRNGLIVAILGVGNKARPYDEADQLMIQQLADQAWDLAEIKRAHEALRDSEARWNFALEGAGESVWDWDVQTGSVRHSPRWAAMLGYSEQAVGNRIDDWKRLIHPDDAAATQATLSAYLSRKAAHYAAEFRVLCQDGRWKWVLSRGMTVQRLPDGSPARLIGTNADISERKEAELQFSHLAFHDGLTDLPNRALFFDRLSQAISQARRNRHRVAILFMDLDGFKRVNDLHGHEAGDRVLKIIAERLLAGVREVDTVARMGGDEFTVILGELDGPATAQGVAEKLVQTIAQPIELAYGLACTVGASIGISLYPEHGTEMDTLLLAADQAMYQSKSQGKGRFTFSTGVTSVAVPDDQWASFGAQHLVGIDEIDEQHRHLAELVNVLNRSIKTGVDEFALNRLFEELLEYTRFHFKSEHDLMVRYNYPRQSAHDREHARLLTQAEQFKARLSAGGDLLVLQAIKDWLLHHIHFEDKPLGEFLKTAQAQDQRPAAA